MTKLKKLLLTLAPISAVMIATPIILTSCSTNAEQNNGGGSTGGGSGTGGDTGGSGNGGTTPENPKVEKDKTNNENFIPTKEGLYKKVEDAIKSGKPEEKEKKINDSFKEYTKPTKLDVEDAINIWSFNKWNDASKEKSISYASTLVDLITSNKEEAGKTKWDISFKYKFQIESKVGDKTENVLAEKLFKVSNIELTSSVAFDTEPTMLMVDGTSKLDEIKPKTLYTATKVEESKIMKDVKTFLNEKTSTFDVLKNLKTFIDTKGIVGEKPATPIPTWEEKASDPMAKVNGTIMTVTLDKAWTGEIKKDAKKDAISKQLGDSKTNAFILTYVKDSAGWTATFDGGNLDASKKILTYKMTLKKNNENDVVLDLVFTPVVG